MEEEKLRPQTIDFNQISRFLIFAEKKLATANAVFGVDEEACYQLAYEAMLKGSLAFMLSFGVRPRSLPGHHVIIIAFAGEKLGKEFKDIITLFQRMRRKRHKAIYDTVLISQSEAQQALATAQQYLGIIREEIYKRNPQVRLF